MNRIQIGGYIRISKKEAARRYNAGEVIRLTACKLSPVPRGVATQTHNGKSTRKLAGTGSTLQ